MRASESRETSAPIMGAIDIVVDPVALFRAIIGRPGWMWVPLLGALIVGTTFWIFYYNAVDFDWLQATLADDLIRSGRVAAEELESVDAFLSRGILMWTTIISFLLLTPAVYLAHAFYYFIVANLLGHKNQGFGDWFNFVCWAYLPAAFVYIVMTVAFFMGEEGRVSVQALDMTSINFLFLDLPPESAYRTVASTISVLYVWVVALMTLGFAMWTERSWAASAVIALLPMVLVFGGWALIAGAWAG